jgi:hypothetical protein
MTAPNQTGERKGRVVRVSLPESRLRRQEINTQLSRSPGKDAVSMQIATPATQL